MGLPVIQTALIAVDDRRGSNRDVKLMHQLAKPATLGNGVGDIMVLGLSTRTGRSGLSFVGPGDQIIAKEDAIA